VGTKNVCLVVVTLFVVVMIVGTEDVVVVRIFVVVLGIRSPRSCWIAEGDGKAARRTATTIRTLTRCAAFIFMLVHALDTSTFLCKYIVVQESFRTVQENSKLRFTRTEG
jgi:hypothetical protein